jgi:hypothetical protein
MRKPLAIHCIQFVLLSCTYSGYQEKTELLHENYKYALVEIDSYDFRRAYHGIDTLEGYALDSFLNRNPWANEIYSNSADHPFFNDLLRLGILDHGDLNLSDLDTLPNQFNYQFKPNHFFKVKTKYMDDPIQVKTPSFELTFWDNARLVLIDTLEFSWPPDVAFFKKDLDEDGSEELLSIFKWYIVNGDNFELKIYQIKKVNQQ